MLLKAPTPLPAASSKILIAPNATFTCFNRTYGSISVGATSVPCHKIHTLYRPRSTSNPQSSQVGREIIEDGSFGRRWKRDAFDAGIDPYPDLYWICDGIRRSLPGDWCGLCAIALLAQEVHIIPVSDNVVSDLSVLPPRSRHHITKRAVVPFGSFDNTITLDAIGMPRGVPDEYKARNEIASRFIHLVPFIGASIETQKNTEWFNYIYYNQQRFINHTTAAIKGLADQLSPTSLVSWQNRMGLDLLFAERGGICFMFGDACCTYIPNNTAPDGSVSKAIAALESLSKEWTENSGIAHPLDWNSIQKFFNDWKGVLISFLAVFVLCLGIFALCGCCIIPCIRGLITRTVDASITKTT